MAFINKHDTNGTKGLLAKGELGYDDYAAGGDTGRVYVGTGTENIALAERLESNMMTKAQFNALAEERKANRAGSGFDEFGSNHSIRSGNVNKGIFTPSGADAVPNQIWLSLEDTTSQKTPDGYPFTIINGVIQKLKSIGANYNKIQVPTAPTIYPHDTVLTPEQIASGVIKHADASNSGLIVNGKFDVDTSGWTGVKSTIASVLGKLRITLTDVEGGAYQFISTVIGKKYILELDTTFGTNTDISIRAYTGTFGTLLANKTTTVQGRHLLEFTATATSTMIYVMTRNAIGKYCDFVNIAVYPADAISRADVVFPESYHEDIAEKGVGYPFGNVQYLGGNTDGLTGIANGAFTGFEQYSLFGNWQTPSSLIGKGYVWSSLTEAQKKAFIANPENNCYMDGDKTIQVRYRVRVVQGVGDNWDYPFYNMVDGRGSNPPGSTVSYSAPSFYIKPKGKLASISYDLTRYDTSETGFFANKNYTNITTGYEIGMATAVNKAASALDTNVAHEGKCYAIPLALVHRRNQGMYHNVYNPNGTKLASDGLDCFRTTVSFTSTMDCFDPAKLLTASGYIGTVSGRPDGLFYDQVHESDIQDLRNSSKKVEDYNRLISREFNKLVAGTYRGKEGERFIERFGKLKLQATSYNVYGSTAVRLEGIPNNYIFDNTTSVSYGNSTYFEHIGFIKGNTKYYKVGYISSASTSVVYLSPEYGNVVSDFTTSVEYDVIACPKSTRTKSNTLLHCDIIGNPTNYPVSWKQSGVFGTPLIVAEDGTSLLPNGTLDTFKLSRKANATPLLCLRSTDNGATWTSFAPTFSTITNAITLTDEPAGNLVLVYYQTKTSMAIPIINSEVLEIGEVLGTNGLANGALVSTLIGKVPTASTTPYSQRGYGINGYRIDMSTFKFSATELPAHSALSLAGGAIGAPAVKVLPYLTRLNGKAYLNLVFKEMKHNGTSWGDSSKFEIVDNVSTTTDNNAQTVLIGQKTVELNMFVGADE